MKTIVLCNLPRFSTEIWLPILWAQAKTYHERYGNSKWHWWPCHLDAYGSGYEEQIKEELLRAKPDIFAMSLYVWNYRLSHEIARWVKEQFPKCLIITGGPHQYIKHDLNWFRQHPYIDASLPGDCYGERSISEILDNYDEGTVDWSKVTDMTYPSGRSLMITHSPRTMTRADKKDYEFNWSGFTDQYDHLKHFERFVQDRFPDSMLLSVLETTRGCPYGCTYCDWGGGIATAVIKRDIEVVRQDINSICDFDLTYLYLADANFGIFGDRDVDIIKYLIQRKKEKNSQFKVGYGGFAKTENRLDSIRQILEADIENSLSNNKEIKLSLQTLDQQTLDNIDRKNIDLDRQLEVFRPMARETHLPLYVEIIMGLPGMTLDKFYYELDRFGKERLSIQWFEWILLPEAPSYSREYRDKWKIETTAKTNGWSHPDSHAQHEIVVSTSTYSTDDYLEMLLASGMYDLIIQGGFFRDTIHRHGIGIGDLIRRFMKDNPPALDGQWRNILDEPARDCSIDGIYLGHYYPVKAFMDEEFLDMYSDWLSKTYGVDSSVESKKLNNTARAGRSEWRGLIKKHFPWNDAKSIVNKYRLFERDIMRAEERILGVWQRKRNQTW